MVVRGFYLFTQVFEEACVHPSSTSLSTSDNTLKEEKKTETKASSRAERLETKQHQNSVRGQDQQTDATETKAKEGRGRHKRKLKVPGVFSFHHFEVCWLSVRSIPWLQGSNPNCMQIGVCRTRKTWCHVSAILLASTSGKCVSYGTMKKHYLQSMILYIGTCVPLSFESDGRVCQILFVLHAIQLWRCNIIATKSHVCAIQPGGDV